MITYNPEIELKFIGFNFCEKNVDVHIKRAYIKVETITI